MADIKAKITEIAEKLQKDEKLMAQFKTDPIKAVESLAGVELPDELLEKLVSGVKAKLGADTLAGAADALKKLF